MKKHQTTPSRIVAKRKLGFRRKMSTRAGRAVIARRRRKGRKRLCV